MAQSISQEAIGATGLPGATAASRYAGATTSGAPTTGTFAVGDYVVDQTGNEWVCTVAGTPGTWVALRNATQLQGTAVSSTAPTSNQVLTYNSGTSSWTPTTASAGGLTLISTTTVSGTTTTSVTLSSIPQTYNNLKVIAVTKSDASGFGQQIYGYINGVNNTFYYGAYSLLSQAGGIGGSVVNVSNCLIYSQTTAASSQIFGNFVLDFPNYANTTQYKTWNFTSNWTTQSSANGGASSGSGNYYNTTAAITSLVFTVGGTANFLAGSVFYLYGY